MTHTIVQKDQMISFDFTLWQLNGYNICYANGEIPDSVHYDSKAKYIRSITANGVNIDHDLAGLAILPEADYDLKFYSVSGNTLENKTKRPPIGLMPRKLHNEARIKDIVEAMARFMDESKQIPLEWIDELSELSRWNENK